MRVSLKLIVVALNLAAVLAVGLTAFVPTLLQGISSANEIGDELLASVNANLNHGITSIVLQLSQMSTNMARVITAAPNIDQESLKGLFAEVMFEYNSIGCAYLSIGTEQGYFYGLEVTNEKRWDWRVLNATVVCRTRYELNNVTLEEMLPSANATEVRCGYNPRSRVWYTSLNNTYMDVSLAYAYTTSATSAVTFGKQVRWPDGRPLGVFAADATSYSLTNILQRTKYGKTGAAMIVEVATMNVLALSTGEIVLSNYNLSNVNSASISIKKVSQVESPLLRRMVAALGPRLAQQNVTTFNERVNDVWVSVTDIRVLPRMHWRFVVVIPVNDYLGEITAKRDTVIVVVSVLIVVFIAAFVGILYKVLNPVTVLQEQLALAARLEFQDDAETLQNMSVIGEISYLQEKFTSLTNAMLSFTKYMPKDVVKDMMFSGSGLAVLGMSPRPIAVMFIDIAGFTALCEAVSVDTLSSLLPIYFGEAVRVLLSHGATIDKFIGDAIMCFWGAPLETENSCASAAYAALHFINQVRSSISPQFKSITAGDLPGVNVRIGIHEGGALVGNLGCVDRMSYTAMGDTVNIASRLEGMNKYFGSAVMISSSVQQALPADEFILRYLGRCTVQGRAEPIRIYELLGVSSAARAGTSSSCDTQSLQSTPSQGRKEFYKQVHCLRDAVHRKNVLSLEEAQQIVAKVQPNFAHDDIAAVELYSSAVERYENGEFAIAAKDFQRCAQLAQRGSSMKDIVADFRKRQAACESLGASCPANWSPILAGEK